MIMVLDPGRVDADLPAGALGDAVQALAAAVVAYCCRFTQPVEPWALIAAFVHGRLLAPVPTS